MSLKLSYNKQGTPFQAGEIRPLRDWTGKIEKGHYEYYTHSGHFLHIVIMPAYTEHVYIDICDRGAHNTVYLHNVSDLYSFKCLLETWKKANVDITADLAEFLYEKAEGYVNKL